MKKLDPALATHLASGVTTLCWCWKLTRRDGVALGFTDHDRDVTFDGTTYVASSGFSASEVRESVGLNVDNLDVSGAVSADCLAPEDLNAGLYDEATIALFRVNWTAPEQHVLVRSGSLGEVTRNDAAFIAEIRGLAHYLQQPSGRVYQYACDAEIGDARCGVDLSTSAFSGLATLSAVVSDRAVAVSGLSAFAGGWFARGLATFESGANAGMALEIKAHVKVGDAVQLEFWRSPTRAMAIGDTCSVTAGCDKQIATCRSKFANAVNYRGFPDMPGNDAVTRIVSRS